MPGKILRIGLVLVLVGLMLGGLPASVKVAQAAPTYNLTVDITGQGNVTINGTTPASYPNTTTWVNDTVVGLDAMPDANYTFINWTGDTGTIADPGAANTTINMTGNYSIVANFEPVGIGATLIGHMTFPGTVAGRVMTVRFYHPSNKTETSWSPLSSTTDASGNFTVTNLTAGTWDVAVKNYSCLSEMMLSVTFTAGNTTCVDFGASREGDCNGDDWVTVVDKSLLYAAWGTTGGDPAWEPHCDLNRDTWITVADKSIMHGNWGAAGDKVGY